MFPHLACVVNAASAGVLAMMRRDIALLYFEGSGEELNSRHPAKEELAHMGMFAGRQLFASRGNLTRVEDQSASLEKLTSLDW